MYQPSKKIQELENQVKSLQKKIIDLKNTNQKPFISDQEHKYHNLNKEDSIWKKAFEVIEIAVLFIDSNGIILGINNGALKLLQYKFKKKIIGKTITEILLETEFDEWHAISEKVKNLSTPVEIYKNIRTNENDIFESKVKVNLLDSEQFKYIVSIENISHEIELKKKNSLLERLVFFRKSITGINSISNLIQQICNSLLKISNAYNIWILQYDPENNCICYYYTRKNEVRSIENLDHKSIHNELTKLSYLQLKVNILINREVININPNNTKGNVNNQLVTISKTQYGANIYIGLNYADTKNLHLADIEFLENITDLTQSTFNGLLAYETIKKNELKFKGLIENQIDVVVVHDKDNTIKYISPSVEKYGVTQKEVIGKSAITFQHPEDKMKIKDAINTIMETKGKSINLPRVKLIPKPGMIVYTNISYTNLLHQKGIEGIVVNIHDITNQVKYEKNLEASESMYRALFENAGDGISIVKGSKILHTNYRLQEILETTKEDLQVKTPLDYSPELQPDGTVSTEKYFMYIQQGLEGNNKPFYWRSISAKGNPVDLQITLSRVELPDDVYVVAFFKDVTKELLAQKKLESSESRYKALTEKQNDVIVIRTLEGVYTYVSPSTKNYGFSSEEIIGKSKIDFIHPEDSHLIDKAVQEIIKVEGKSVSIPKIRVWLKKKLKYAHIIFTNLLQQKGVEGILLNIRDITEQVWYEKKLESSERMYRALFENAGDGISIVKGNKIVHTNYRLQEILETTKEDLQVKTPLDFSPELQPDGSASAEKYFNYIQQGLEGITKPFYWRCISVKGNPVDLQITLSRVKLPDDVYVVAFFRDITQELHIQRELEENEKQLRTIFESMSDGIYVCSDNYEINYYNEAMQSQLISPLDKVNKCYKNVYGFDEPCSWCNKEISKKSSSVYVEIFNEKTKRYYQVARTNIIMNGIPSTLHISRDITDIKKAQIEISQSEEKFRNIFDNSSDAIFITNLKGDYLEMNNRGLSRIGYSLEEVTKMSFIGMSRFSKENETKKYLEEVMRDEHSTTQMSYVNRKGENIYTEINSQLIKYQGKKAILHISRDISLRKELEQKILKATIQTEENERKRFAQDLHDGIGPYLSATKLFIKTLSESQEKQQRENLSQKALHSINEIISNIKEISNNISPHILKNFGIASAVKSFSKKLKNLDAEIIFETNIEGIRFNEDLETSVFRIITELLNNTIKYGEATIIEIFLKKIEQNLEINYLHNGKGFDYEKTIKENKGQGLFNIINRVNSLHGKYEFITNEKSNFQFNATFKF